MKNTKNKSVKIGISLLILIFAVVGFSMAVVGCNSGEEEKYNSPEEMPEAKRWVSWVADDSTATINISVADDGVCTIIVGGTAMPPQSVDGSVPAYWNSIWKANIQYKYTAVKGKTYTYTFEAWTDGADRAMVVQWYGDSASQIYENTGYNGPTNPPPFTINSTRQTYTLKGTNPTPKSGEQDFSFQCANQIGTFYVKIISIKEYSASGGDDDESGSGGDSKISPPRLFPLYSHSGVDYDIHFQSLSSSSGIFFLIDTLNPYEEQLQGTYTFTYTFNPNNITFSNMTISFVFNEDNFTAPCSADRGYITSFIISGITGENAYLNGTWTRE